MSVVLWTAEMEGLVHLSYASRTLCGLEALIGFEKRPLEAVSCERCRDWFRNMTSSLGVEWRG